MHLVGFITKKFFTMHGHMNVKFNAKQAKETYQYRDTKGITKFAEENSLNPPTYPSNSKAVYKPV